MKRYFIPLIVFACLSTNVWAGWFVQKQIYSKALKQNKTYFVGLPEGYQEADTSKRYPVIIFLHGASVTAGDMVNSLEPFLGNFLTKYLFSNLFKVIFVIPDGSCEPYKGSFYTNSELYGNYEDFINQDIIEEIRNNYHTFSGREKWSIMGHSMGAYGAMKIALKHPDQFIGVSSLSGPLNITRFDELLPDVLSENGNSAPYEFKYEGNVSKLMFTMAGAFSPEPQNSPPVKFPITANGEIDQEVKLLWENNNPINLIRNWHGNPAMAIQTYCGEKDEFKLVSQNRMFVDTLSRYHLQHTYIQDPNGDHIYSLFTSMPKGINFLYQVMDTARVVTGTRIDVKQLSNIFTVYPNPAGEKVYASVNSGKISQIEIYSLTGQLLLRKDYPDSDHGIDISNFYPGVYVLKLQNNEGLNSSIRMVKL